MSKLSTLTPIAAVLAVAVAGFSHAAENPFAVKPVAGMVLADAGKEGHCGAGMMKDDGKTMMDDGKAMKEGKCGKDKMNDDGKAMMGDGKAMKEGKCGEGKCGAKKKAAEAAAAKAAAAKAAAETVAPVAAPAAK